MTLTQSEYDKVKGLVAYRPDRLRELNIDSDARLPWDNPDQLQGVGIRIKTEGGANLSVGARVLPSKDLIAFLSNARASHSSMPMSFSNVYVRYWFELEQRVKLFEEDRKPDKERAQRAEERAQLAEERAQRAEERAKRDAKRALVGMVVGILGLLIAAITLALKIL